MVSLVIGATGCVQQWECDQNAHMNVRFYGRAFESAVSYCLQQAQVNSNWRAVESTIRFHKELRNFAPWKVTCAAVLTSINHGDRKIQLSLTMFTSGETLSASNLLTLELDSDADVQAVKQILPCIDQAADTVAPRGTAVTNIKADWHLDEAKKMGMNLITRFPLESWEHRHGVLLGSSLMRRVSDGIANLITAPSTAQLENKQRGGAVLEYRIVFRHKTIQQINDAGDPPVIETHAGMINVNRSTYHWAHWHFDSVTKLPVASTQAVVVGLNLETRTSIKNSEEDLVNLRKNIIPGLSA